MGMGAISGLIRPLELTPILGPEAHLRAWLLHRGGPSGMMKNRGAGSTRP
jgi:hypothetical protein